MTNNKGPNIIINVEFLIGMWMMSLKISVVSGKIKNYKMRGILKVVEI